MRSSRSAGSCLSRAGGVAARTYRAWQARRTLSARMLALAYLMNAIHSLAYAWEPAAVGGFRLRPEGCTGGGR